MQTPWRWVLVTSDGLRHRWVAHQLARRLDLVGVIAEAKRVPNSPAPSTDPIGAADLARHFSERDAVETRMLGHPKEFSGDRVLSIGAGELNTPAVGEWIRRRNPDALLLFGSGLLKDPLLTEFAGRVINLHLGLSPYYRGAGTNFWPFVHGRPECVGATLHLAVADVDAGGILGQVRPEPAEDDRIHEMGTRTIMAAVGVLPECVARYAAGVRVPQAQDLRNGLVFRVRDFGVEPLRLAWRNLDAGLMREYVGRRWEREAACPIVTAPS